MLQEVPVSANSEAVHEDSFYNKLGIPLGSLTTAIAAIEVNRFTRNVVCLVGSPGIGKTHVMQQIAAGRKPQKPFMWNGEEWKDRVPVKTMYLAHIMGEDLAVPYPSRAKQNEILTRARQLQDLVAFAQAQGKSELAAQLTAEALELMGKIATMDAKTKKNGTMEFLINKELAELPEEGILFLDEWNRADKSVIKSFFTLLEDGEVHGIKLIPPRLQIVAAMNPSDGGYSVNEAEKDHAFRRRLTFVAVTTNAGTWLRYAQDKFHPLVVDFIRSMPDTLYDAKLLSASKVFPCPATWEKVSNLLQEADKTSLNLNHEGVKASIAGLVGEGAARIFSDYIQDNSVVIAPNEIIKRYTERAAVRTKVQHLVELARHDVLSELCTSVAVTLMSDQPSAQVTAPFLGRFMADLPSDVAVGFISQKLPSAAKDVEGASEFMRELSESLYHQPAYRELFKEISDATQRTEAEVDGEMARFDPLAV